MRKFDPFLPFSILESYLLKQRKSRERFVFFGEMYTVTLKLLVSRLGNNFYC